MINIWITNKLIRVFVLVCVRACVRTFYSLVLHFVRFIDFIIHVRRTLRSTDCIKQRRSPFLLNYHVANIIYILCFIHIGRIFSIFLINRIKPFLTLTLPKMLHCFTSYSKIYSCQEGHKLKVDLRNMKIVKECIFCC